MPLDLTIKSFPSNLPRAIVHVETGKKRAWSEGRFDAVPHHPN
jgi:hypothetical protein